MPTPIPMKRARPDAITAVELIWPVPPPVLPLPRARPGVLASPLAAAPLPSLHALAEIARAIAAEQTFDAAAIRIQREACRLTGSSEALCLAFDWPRRRAWSVTGPVTCGQVEELVAQVAGSGRRAVVGGALVEPIGATPARAVLALRRPAGTTFRPTDIAVVAALAGGIAATLERLLVSARP